MKVDSRHGKSAETHFRVLQSLSGCGATSTVPSDFGVRRRVGALKSGDTSPQSTIGSRGRSPHQSKLSGTKAEKFTLIEAKPVTGRTHQIRVHLAESGLPIVGDELYGKSLTRPRFNGATLSPSDGARDNLPLGLRAVRLAYVDPFTKRRVDIRAPTEKFLKEFGF
jgi:23S rRNA-/tRNA-specific pseudouridylate synthase